jgi:predicted helicase
MPLGIKAEKGTKDVESVFRLFSLGVAANRDAWVYSFHAGELEKNILTTLETYTAEVSALKKSLREAKKHTVSITESKIKWTDRLLDALKDQRKIAFVPRSIRQASYRPFSRQWLYFDHLLNQRRYQQHIFIPNGDDVSNTMLCWNSSASSGPAVLATKLVPDLHFVGDSQCFAFFVYDADGTNRRENITDWALTEFRTHYADQTITKWNIFHATYAILHHPEYRTRYAANLKRELPRIPFPPDFHAFARAGQRLMELHIDYEQQPEYPLEHIESEDPAIDVSFRVEKMKLAKDKSSLRYNDFLTLRGIPPAAFDYRLGNRSALEWVIDQYRVSTDARSGIRNDPNREDDPQYIIRLIGQVITVSLETQRLIASLPSLGLGEAADDISPSAS